MHNIMDEKKPILTTGYGIDSTFCYMPSSVLLSIVIIIKMFKMKIERKQSTKTQKKYDDHTGDMQFFSYYTEYTFGPYCKYHLRAYWN